MKPKILTTLPTTTRASLIADLWAGVTVALVALPLSIAIAISSGATPAQGLVTAVVAGFLISALGGSRVQIGGPTGAFIVVVAGVIADHGPDGLLIATFMAGMILVAAGLLRLGGLIVWVPRPVIDGFTVGVAIVIALSQVKDALGLALDAEPADLLPKVAALAEAATSLSWPSAAVALLTGMLIVAFRRAAPRLPGLIVAVAATSALAFALAQLSGQPVETLASRFGALPRGLPPPALPDMSPDRLVALLPSALVIAFLAGVESLLSAVVADRMIGGKHRPHAEVLAQGVANMASAAFGGLPATGAIARTATNVRAGGRTPIAGMAHAVAILGLVALAGPLIGHLAMPALAALLILTAWNMSEPHLWAERLSMRRDDLAVFAMTLGLTVLADLTIAIAIGTAAGLIVKARRREGPVSEIRPPER